MNFFKKINYFLIIQVIHEYNLLIKHNFILDKRLLSFDFILLPWSSEKMDLKSLVYILPDPFLCSCYMYPCKRLLCALSYSIYVFTYSSNIYI